MPCQSRLVAHQVNECSLLLCFLVHHLKIWNDSFHKCVPRQFSLGQGKTSSNGGKGFELDPMLKRVCIQKKIRQSILFDGS